ncbi:hydroxycarboxylic acid receptor 3-like [Erpetoichthys calabaricus]|uniref:hydroxycarboxylic acid receptor 3-like n=1 Tax=Erpetoichthys calabaricus TaxID=27687 RepID=UPI00109F2FB5|nr:hydroxycarboxylic acid receptor 3-like [Erpetoichthys calabaricus]
MDDLCLFDGDTLLPILPPILLIEFIVGGLCNGIALWIFCFRIKTWNSSTILLFNLVLADFLLLLALPFRTNYYLQHKNWVLGDWFCRMNLFMLAMNRTGSIFFLTAVALDRYFKVVHPYSQLSAPSVAKTICTSCILWLMATSMTAYLLVKPKLFQKNDTEAVIHCESFAISLSFDSHGLWHWSLFLLEIFLPFCIVLYCTCHFVRKLQKRELNKQGRIQKAIRLTIVVIIVFLLCFLPSSLTSIVIWIKRASYHKECQSFKVWDNTFYITMSLTYMSCVMDPVIYCFSSTTFQELYFFKLWKTFKKKTVTGVTDLRTRQSEDTTIASERPANHLLVQ